MFGLFKSSKQKLESRYSKLMQQAYELSHIDRKKSDQKYAEAEALRKQIDEQTE